MPSEVLGSAPGLAVDHESERVFTPAGASTTAPSSSRLPPFDAEDARERLRRPWGRQDRRREALAPDAALHLLESISMCRKRPFATDGRGRLQTSPAVCRIPCRILCLADVASAAQAAGDHLVARCRQPPRCGWVKRKSSRRRVMSILPQHRAVNCAPFGRNAPWITLIPRVSRNSATGTKSRSDETSTAMS